MIDKNKREKIFNKTLEAIKSLHDSTCRSTYAESNLLHTALVSLAAAHNMLIDAIQESKEDT
jgi:hypothetical protein